MMNITLDTPLKGDELLSKVKKLARQCGYYSTTENGIEKVNMSQFLNALFDTKGIDLEQIYHKKNRGRSASYKIKVQSNGNIVIGSSYTQKMGLKPGDEFEITLGRKHIYLKQVENDDFIEQNINERFYSLAQKWQNDVEGLSSMAQMTKHPAYQEIINMGEDVIPFLLKDLETNPLYWLTALHTITGENPIKPEQKGRIKQMAQAWLDWGKTKQYIA